MTAAAFGVQSIPTVITFKDGKPVDGFIGAYPEPEVNRFIDTIVPTEAEKQAEEAGPSRSPAISRPLRSGTGRCWRTTPTTARPRSAWARIVLERDEPTRLRS